MPDERITALVEKGGAGNITTKVKLEDKVSLPLVKGDEIGVLEVYQNEEKIAEYSLVAAGDVNKASFRQMYQDSLKKYFSGQPPVLHTEDKRRTPDIPASAEGFQTFGGE